MVSMYLDELKTLEQGDFYNKKVILRTDYNVPFTQDGEIADEYRIKSSLPTIKKLFKLGASQVIIASHLGRPKGKTDKRARLDKIAKKILYLTGKRVEKLDDCIDVEEIMPTPTEAPIVVLENLRFHEEEEENDVEFAEKLASLGDVYVNDAFAVCHRKHASVHAITNYLPCYIGLLVEKELKVFELIEKPDRPFTAIIGGSKLETKLPLIENLLGKVDNLLLGGAMIFTFYKAQGYRVGKSLVDKDYLDTAKRLESTDNLVLPTDFVIADDKDDPSQRVNVKVGDIPSYTIGLDIGEKTVKDYCKLLSEAKLVVWNGPMGYVENNKFAQGTLKLLKYLSEQTKAKVIIGGGDTASLVERKGLRDKFYHVSTGGGASLKLLEGTGLVALDAMLDS